MNEMGLIKISSNPSCIFGLYHRVILPENMKMQTEREVSRPHLSYNDFCPNSSLTKDTANTKMLGLLNPSPCYRNVLESSVNV